MGNPNRGPRERLVLRAPTHIASSISQRAEDEGLSVSSYITSVLARELQIELPGYLQEEQEQANRRREARLSA